MGINLIITLYLLVKLQPEVSCSLLENMSLPNNIGLRRGPSIPGEEEILDSVMSEIKIHRSYAQLQPLKEDTKLREMAGDNINPLIVQYDATNDECNWDKTSPSTWDELNNLAKYDRLSKDGFDIEYHIFRTKKDEDLLATHGGLSLVRKEYEKARGIYQFPGEERPYSDCNNTDPDDRGVSTSAFTSIVRESADQIGCSFKKNKGTDPCSTLLCLFRVPADWKNLRLMQNSQFEALNANGETVVSCNRTLQEKVGGSQSPTLSYLLRLLLVFANLHLHW